MLVVAFLVVQRCRSSTADEGDHKQTKQMEASPTGRDCDPNYSGCVPIASDVDCAEGKGNGPAFVKGPVKVIGKDIYRLDRDGNGIGCE